MTPLSISLCTRVDDDDDASAAFVSLLDNRIIIRLINSRSSKQSIRRIIFLPLSKTFFAKLNDAKLHSDLGGGRE